jgi:hypothetical protein
VAVRPFDTSSTNMQVPAMTHGKYRERVKDPGKTGSPEVR